MASRYSVLFWTFCVGNSARACWTAAWVPSLPSVRTSIMPAAVGTSSFSSVSRLTIMPV